MNYLKYDKEDLNSIFKPWQETEFEHFLDRKKLKRPLLKSIPKMYPFANVRFMSEDGWDTLELEDMKESSNEYLESAQVLYDFDSFQEDIVLKKFENDVQNYVSQLKKNYINYIDEGIVSGTDTEAHKFFRDHLKALNDAYNSLKELPLNDLHKIQQIISKIHQENYLQTYEYFSINYRDLYDHLLKNFKVGEVSNNGSGAHDNILKFIILGKDKLFFKFEEELSQRDYLNKAGNLWKMDEKKSLLMFYIYCNSRGIIKPIFKDTAKPLKELESRYNFEVGDQAKPHRWLNKPKYSQQMAEAEFFFLNNIK